jgi:hypothetical protein
MKRWLHGVSGVLAGAVVFALVAGAGASFLFAADEPAAEGEEEEVKPLFGNKPEKDDDAGGAEGMDEEEEEDDGDDDVQSGLGKLKPQQGDWAPDAKPEKKKPRAKKSSKKAADPKVAARVDLLLNGMEKLYEKRIDSPDWVSRALATTSLARSPRESMLERMLQIVERDKHPVVRLVAWQGVLARADRLDKATHARWLKATMPMAKKGWFNGPLRVTLLEVLATAPATPQARKVYGALFDTANAWEPQDMATLDALAACLKTWKSEPVAEALVKRLADPNACVRAEYVLRAAGSTAKPVRDLLSPAVFDGFAKQRQHPSSTELWAHVQSSHAAWLKQVRSEWKGAEPSAEDEPWRELKPKYVPPPVELADIDPNDPVWRQDLELGRVNLSEFEVVFVVDATGSMGEVIDWLKRDVGKMLAAFAVVSTKPRLGVTFYRDAGAGFDARTFPLTGKAGPLLEQMASVTAEGGGDIPEAVLAGLGSAIKKNKWTSKGKSDSRVVVLVGDAPPHPKDVAKCVELAAQFGRDGWRFHTVKVKTNDGQQADLSSFEEIAKAGRGQCIDVAFPPITRVRFLDQQQKEIPVKTMARPEAQLITAGRPPKDHPGEAILSTVLGNAMNPQYHGRMQPMLRTLMAFAEQRPAPEARLAFPANTPPLNEGMLKRQ